MVNWSAIDDKLKSSEERKAESEAMAREEAAGIRSQIQGWAAQFEADLHTLSQRLG
jgi:hypothetical protein